MARNPRFIAQARKFFHKTADVNISDDGEPFMCRMCGNDSWTPICGHCQSVMDSEQEHDFDVEASKRTMPIRPDEVRDLWSLRTAEADPDDWYDDMRVDRAEAQEQDEDDQYWQDWMTDQAIDQQREGSRKHATNPTCKRCGWAQATRDITNADRDSDYCFGCQADIMRENEDYDPYDATGSRRTAGYEDEYPEDDEPEYIPTPLDEANEGVTKCFCGCKYWENGACVDCGTEVTKIPGYFTASRKTAGYDDGVFVEGGVCPFCSSGRLAEQNGDLVCFDCGNDIPAWMNDAKFSKRAKRKTAANWELGGLEGAWYLYSETDNSYAQIQDMHELTGIYDQLQWWWSVYNDDLDEVAYGEESEMVHAEVAAERALSALTSTAKRKTAGNPDSMRCDNCGTNWTTNGRFWCDECIAKREAKEGKRKIAAPVKFPSKCKECGASIPVGSGDVRKKDGAWYTTCDAHKPAPKQRQSTDWYEDDDDPDHHSRGYGVPGGRRY